MHATIGKHLPKVVSVRNMKLLKWGSILAGIVSLVVMYVLKENHMVSTAISAGVYEGSKLAQEFLEPLIRTMENLTEGAEKVAEVIEDVAEEIA